MAFHLLHDPRRSMLTLSVLQLRKQKARGGFRGRGCPERGEGERKRSWREFWSQISFRVSRVTGWGVGEG